MAKIDGATCERIVGQVSAHCAAAAAPVTEDHAHLSAADALTSVAVAISLATFGLAVLVAIATVGWFWYVRHRTKEEAKAEVAKVAPSHINSYLQENLPGMVAETVATFMGGLQEPPPGEMTPQDQSRTLGDDVGPSA